MTSQRAGSLQVCCSLVEYVQKLYCGRIPWPTYTLYTDLEASSRPKLLSWPRYR